MFAFLYVKVNSKQIREEISFPSFFQKMLMIAVFLRFKANYLQKLHGKVKGKACFTSHEAHQAGAYPGFCSIKRLRVSLLPPGWDASPSQGYPPALNSPVPIYTPGWRGAL